MHTEKAQNLPPPGVGEVNQRHRNHMLPMMTYHVRFGNFTSKHK